MTTPDPVCPCGHPKNEHDTLWQGSSQRDKSFCRACPGYERPYGKAWRRFREEKP